uniref:Ankyrin and armadillo repeat-containing protein n=1 Tax=Phallusia mammillata TaxID=59560 RepID=A0A6F9D6W5_9ASCI|nr:ankyrin and armadillo repeat-containing protein [Phallusia mammillata]
MILTQVYICHQHLQMGEQRAGSTPWPATAGLTTGRSSISSLTPRQSTPSDDSGPHRDALLYYDSFKKEGLWELIAQSTASWVLSLDFRGNSTLPCRLISNLTLNQDPQITLLFPKDSKVPDLQYRELHQIVRELTNGIYGGNQMPSLCLEPNFDRSSTCQIPVVYKDTRVGQILVAVDYAMKSFWHGVSVPTKKRSKLSERWRALLDVNTATGEYSKHKNPISEFTAAGRWRCTVVKM